LETAKIWPHVKLTEGFYTGEIRSDKTKMGKVKD